MNKLYIFIGLQRCGTHAIANWILKQRDNYQPATLEHISNGVFLLPNQNKPVYFLNSQQIDKNLREQRQAAILDIEVESDILVCIESGKLNYYNQEKMLDGLFPNHQKFTIVALRDVWNCFASFYKKYNTVPMHIPLEWESRADVILGKRQHITEPFDFIDYNKWFTDINYRKELAEGWGAMFTDHGINEVPDFGSGSSFDQRSLHNQGSKMKVLSRHKEFEQDRRFLRHLNPYLEMVSKKIFNYEHRPDE